MGPNAKRTICKFWEQGSCTRGADCTFAHGSADLAEVNGGRVHQESVAAVGTKRTICKFWLEGACTKGAVCSFAHGEEEIGPNGVKRTICKFWEQGTCTKGGECTWAHGHEELGAAIPVERAVAVKRNSTVFTTLQPYATAVPVKGGKGMTGKSHGQTSVFQMQGQAPQFEVLQSLSFGVEQPVKKTMCKFWLEAQRSGAGGLAVAAFRRACREPEERLRLLRCLTRRNAKHPTAFLRLSEALLAAKPDEAADALRKHLESWHLQTSHLAPRTGLLGEQLRDSAPRAFLEGLDLSAAMLSQAEKKGCYDLLHRTDMCQFLEANDEVDYRLITAADVFVYET
eukprot:g255.t1